MTRNGAALPRVLVLAATALLMTILPAARAEDAKPKPPAAPRKPSDPVASLFKGNVEVRGNALQATYDFSDETQLQDFICVHATPAIVDGELELAPESDWPHNFIAAFKNVVFEGTVSVEADVTIPSLSRALVIVSVFYDSRLPSGYRFLLHSDEVKRWSERRHAIMKDSVQGEKRFRFDNLVIKGKLKADWLRKAAAQAAAVRREEGEKEEGNPDSKQP